MTATSGDIPWLSVAGVCVVGGALATVILIILLRPLLQRYALARPNVRSSHLMPTPQGGGIAVVAATAVAIYLSSAFLLPAALMKSQLVVLLAASIVMAAVGAVADIRPIAVAPRLILQVIAVGAVICALPTELRVLPVVPLWLERTFLVVGGVWFVNLVNFMDGLDWITAAEVVPLTGAVAILGLLGLLPPQAVAVSLALCGAMIGFGYFNRPIATLFLGDVGSLPIGLVLGWLLVLLAGNGAREAAILLPLYYVADSTITLLRRVFRGEQVSQAHRTHFYQRATDGGFTVMEIVARVFSVNLMLCGLAIISAIMVSSIGKLGTIAVGAMLVAWLLNTFARGKR